MGPEGSSLTRDSNADGGAGLKLDNWIKKCYVGYYKKGFMKQNIYYTIDEETGKIILDLYEMEQEALKQLKKEFPKKKVESVYVT